MEETQIKNIVVKYYQSLFSTFSLSEFSDILGKFQPSITDSMNAMLLRDFNKEEVEITINQMKAVCPRSFIGLFGILWVMMFALLY